MSQIDKLAIQGIRNFGPETPEIIAFDPPVTLILGKNGSGKTTIIESLKYVTTGETPPGTGRGQSFIHNPELSPKHISIGQVKLQFRDEMGCQYVVTRSMECRVFTKKPEFKTTDATVSIVQPDGTLKNVKQKIDDLNTFVCNKLGVSKSLLNNVLFCHQEDSNWPLDESKKVKEKFDEIFNTTKYVKCQDEISKLMKETKSKIKEMSVSVGHYKNLKDQADKYRRDLESHKERRTVLVQDLENLESSRREMDSKLKSLTEKYKDCDKLKEEIRSKKLRMEELERNRRDLESDIEQMLTHCAVEELEDRLVKFRAAKDTRQAELSAKEHQMRDLEEKSAACSVSQQTQLVSLGELRSKEERHSKRILERDRKISDVASKHRLAGYLSIENKPLSTQQVIEWQDKLQVAVKAAQTDQQALKQQLDDEANGLSKCLDGCREQYVRLEQDIKSKTAALGQDTKDLSEVERELLAMDENSRLVESVESELNDAQKLWESADDECKENKLPEKIQQLKSRRAEYETRLNALKPQLDKLQNQRDKRLRLDMMQKEVAVKKQGERRLMSRPNVEEAIQLLLPGVTVDDSLLSKFNQRLNSASAELNRKQQQMTTREKEVAALEADTRNCRNQLQIKRDDLIEQQRKLKVGDVSVACDLESDLDKLVRELADLDDQRGLIYGSEKMIVHYIDKMEKHRSKACPLCHREFEEEAETLELVDELKTRIQQMPVQITQLDKRITDKKARQAELLQLRPVAVNVAKLSDVEIPRLEEELAAMEEKTVSLRTQLRQMQDSIEFLRSEEEVGKRAQADIVQMDANRRERGKLESQVGSLQLELGLSAQDSSMSMEEVQVEVDECNVANTQTQREIERMMGRQNEEQKRLGELKQNVNRLTERRLRLLGQLQKRSQLAERQRVLAENVAKLGDEVNVCRASLAPLAAEKRRSEDAVAQFAKRRDDQLEQERNKVSQLQDSQRQVEHLQKQIDVWFREGRDGRLEAAENKVKQLEEQKSWLESSLKTLQKETADMKLTLSNSENEGRNLKNNIKLIANRGERQDLAAKMHELQDGWKKFNMDKLCSEISSLQKNLDRDKDTMAENRGALHVIAAVIKKLETDLERDDLVKCQQRYTDSIKNHEIHVAISADLTKFHSAFEWALMKFHKEKMAVINNMVREMWHNTYRGNDIDYIEIRAEESEARATTVRRTYNYRVIMSKNGIEMDMRGRCSAGQKVLASLIIRMALAEAFSCKCGVLALDEPTTNLDEENIASLSDTILELSNAMSRQKRKFQLIVITHDEKFLDRMSRDKRMETYYRVSRAKSNLSEISQYDVMKGNVSSKKMAIK